MKQLAERNFFTANSDMSDLVNNELKVDANYHPNLGGISRGGMANHYPMAILSMHELGALDEQIINFKHQWPKYRALIDDTLGLIDKHELTINNWHSYLGQSQKLKEFRRVFIERFSEYETADVITDALKHMSGGLPMGLFHPLIRLSFAATHGDTGLLADALAYMAIRYHNIYQMEPMKTNSLPRVTSSIAIQSWSIIKGLNQNHQLPGQLPNLFLGGSIHVCEQLCCSTVVQELAWSSGFSITIINLKTSIAQICRAAVQLYLTEPSLTTLHAVTASQALADLTQRFAKNDQSRAVFISLWQHYWIWLTALFIEKGCRLSFIEPRESSSTNVDKMDWQQLCKMALATNEVHVIKMVYSCKWLFENIDADFIYKQSAEVMI